MSRQTDGRREIGRVLEVPLHRLTRSRFLNYAVSVITSRALPDVRDGLKPVQRRILYTMHRDLHLGPHTRPLKSAKVVGQVLGNYHPHGDQAVYEALVRMAQPWNFRYPLVEGQGNFGSQDGDAPAAYRYTEANLRPLALEFVEELDQETVDFRPNFDGTSREPVILPARVPQLLINGTTGIAVGMATSIPPHNLKEVVEACQRLIDVPETSTEELLRILKGPDFPTGGELLEDRQELLRVYREGQGRLRVRGQYRTEPAPRRGEDIIITSVPYQANKARIVEEIGEIIAAGKVPQLLDVRDESTDEVRIVCETRRGSDPRAIMAYLYRHTGLQASITVNFTCLVPRERCGREGPAHPPPPPASAALGVPARLGLRELLLHFLEFRHQVVTRRLQHEREIQRRRCHLLEGFAAVFADLDRALERIRSSTGKRDAMQKLMAEFSLDEEQADAVVELKLYRIGSGEIQALRRELAERTERIRTLSELLDSPRSLWGVVRQELGEVADRYGDARRTRIRAWGAPEFSYQEEDFIPEEDVSVLVSRDGWIRRVGQVTDLGKVRLRAGDELIAALAGSTLSTVVFFSNYGSAYTIRIHDISPAPRGYGDPIQKYFRFRDGERVVAAFSLDPRLLPSAPGEEEEEGQLELEFAAEAGDPGPSPLQAVALATDGRGLRFDPAGFAEPSHRTGRKFARLHQGEEVVGVEPIRGEETLIAVTRAGRALLCPVEQVPFLAGPGRGARVIKVARDDRLLGFALGEALTVVRDTGTELRVTTRKYRVTRRGGRGFALIRRGNLERVVRPPLRLPELPEEETDVEFVSS